MDAIYKRRSIRKFSSRPLPRDMIERFIKAGMNAPSAGNQQPWHFIVIDRKKLLEEIPKIHPHSQMIRQAPAAILVCGDLLLEKHEGYWVQDCAAATENMLLAIADEGVGSVWLGVYPRQERVDGLGKLLNLPDHVVPFSLLPVGYPAEEKARKNEFHPERIHYNTWKGGAR
ncbi:MAG: NADH dehydrogenase [Spirochaetes bacterium RBG_13_51_14]|nr:MAG: NADH dehydrogenase [Spirochaetes bacterium RBG_13_51_14]